MKHTVGHVLLYKKKLLQSCKKGNPTQKEEPNRKGQEPAGHGFDSKGRTSDNYS